MSCFMLPILLLQIADSASTKVIVVARRPFVAAVRG